MRADEGKHSISEEVLGGTRYSQGYYGTCEEKSPKHPGDIEKAFIRDEIEKWVDHLEYVVSE